MSHDPLIAFEDDATDPEIHQPYTAFNQGHESGEDETPISLNPYPDGSKEFIWWNMGHNHATGLFDDGDDS